jgi:translocation and assembly module TamB
VLDVTLSAPRAVFVSGRGLDAELGGQVQARGSLVRPDLVGGLDLRRGEFNLAGQTLRFTHGRIGFEGSGPGQASRLDPSLDFEARANAAGATAILAVQGSAQSPRIELRSEPELPEDEILARLLFGTAAGGLSGLQAARLGLAAAELAGLRRLAGISEARILNRARSGLRLDRLSFDTDQQDGAVLEGGRQLSEGLYLGARQGQRAGETQGVLRIEITPRLKLEADVGAGGGSRAGAAFQLDY